MDSWKKDINSLDENLGKRKTAWTHNGFGVNIAKIPSGL